ncbi:MAG: hypothetical protein R3268_00365, partial [Acidiferrobacterales bacterium]|nr:hypothetical protein [Acidiferrobacterales bacterium]
SGTSSRTMGGGRRLGGFSPISYKLLSKDVAFKRQAKVRAALEYYEEARSAGGHPEIEANMALQKYRVRNGPKGKWKVF